MDGNGTGLRSNRGPYKPIPAWPPLLVEGCCTASAEAWCGSLRQWISSNNLKQRITRLVLQVCHTVTNLEAHHIFIIYSWDSLALTCGNQILSFWEILIQSEFLRDLVLKKESTIFQQWSESCIFLFPRSWFAWVVFQRLEARGIGPNMGGQDQGHICFWLRKYFMPIWLK